MLMGFNPGNPPPRRCALKGRQIRRGKTHVENELAHVSSRPFRANRVIEYFPGLKPWAESCSPFGAKPAVMLLILVPFNPGPSPKTPSGDSMTGAKHRLCQLHIRRCTSSLQVGQKASLMNHEFLRFVAEVREPTERL
jgi:hypothetical protein